MGLVDSKPEIKCPNCQYEGKPGSGQSIIVEFILFVLGFFTLGVCWLILIFYKVLTKYWICPKCGYKYVVKK